MSDSTMKEGFFENKDISESLKLRVLFLMMGGTYEKYKRANGNITTFVSHVGGKKS